MWRLHCLVLLSFVSRGPGGGAEAAGWLWPGRLGVWSPARVPVSQRSEERFNISKLKNPARPSSQVPTYPPSSGVEILKFKKFNLFFSARSSPGGGTANIATRNQLIEFPIVENPEFWKLFNFNCGTSASLGQSPPDPTQRGLCGSNLKYQKCCPTQSSAQPLEGEGCNQVRPGNLIIFPVRSPNILSN